MYQNILKLQDVDIDIMKINEKTQKSEYKQVIAAMVQKNKDIQKEKEAKEVEAKKLISVMQDKENEIAAIEKEIDKNSEEYNAKKLSLDNYKQKQAECANKLNLVSKKLIKLQKDFENLQKDFEELKNNAGAVKKKYQMAKDAQEALQDKIASQISALEKTKSELAKTIDKAVLDEYNKYRKDNIMPVYVKMVRDCCGGCMQKLSAAQLSKTSNRIDCEMCRRIIIKD